MVIAEMIVTCPSCESETKLVVEQVNPIIFHCHGCLKNIVIQDNKVYTVSNKFLRNIVRSFKSKVCGKILAAKFSNAVREIGINSEKIEELQKLLNKPMDVRDFLEKI
jgi:heterodisulfide reductase subunit B